MAVNFSSLRWFADLSNPAEDEEVTFSAWVYLTNGNQACPISMGDPDVTNHFHRLIREGSGAWRCSSRAGGGQANTAATGSSPQNTWIYVAGQIGIDGTDRYVFVDEIVSAVNGANRDATVTKVSIGGQSGDTSRLTTGYIAEVIVYNQVLSPDEHAHIYRQKISPYNYQNLDRSKILVYQPMRSAMNEHGSIGPTFTIQSGTSIGGAFHPFTKDRSRAFFVPTILGTVTEKLIAASLSGEGVMTSNLSIEKIVSSVMSGEGTLAANLLVEKLFAAILSGEGTMASNVRVEKLLQAVLSGDSNLVANLIKEKVLAAVLSADGSMTANAIVEKLLSSTLSGEGTLAANLVVEKVLGAVLSGEGTLAGNVLVEKLLAAALSGEGVMTANVQVGTETVVTIQAALSGEGALTGSLTKEKVLSTIMSGEGEIVANIIREVGIAANLSGDSSMIANVIREAVLGATLVGEGTMIANVQVGDDELGRRVVLILL